jgi:hypothetical protein
MRHSRDLVATHIRYMRERRPQTVMGSLFRFKGSLELALRILLRLVITTNRLDISIGSNDNYMSLSYLGGKK